MILPLRTLQSLFECLIKIKQTWLYHWISEGLNCFSLIWWLMRSNWCRLCKYPWLNLIQLKKVTTVVGSGGVRRDEKTQRLVKWKCSLHITVRNSIMDFVMLAFLHKNNRPEYMKRVGEMATHWVPARSVADKFWMWLTVDLQLTRFWPMFHLWINQVVGFY